MQDKQVEFQGPDALWLLMLTLALPAWAVVSYFVDGHLSALLLVSSLLTLATLPFATQSQSVRVNPEGGTWQGIDKFMFFIRRAKTYSADYIAVVRCDSVSGKNYDYYWPTVITKSGKQYCLGLGMKNSEEAQSIANAFREAVGLAPIE